MTYVSETRLMGKTDEDKMDRSERQILTKIYYGVKVETVLPWRR